MLTSFVNGRVVVKTGDITTEDVAAIVNAANSSLLGGGGVDGAIHRAGGPEILAECREIRRTLYPNGLPTGDAVITTAGRLPASKVIHTVGPIYGQHGGREPDLLAACYVSCMKLAMNDALASIAFPAISTGVYGYPKDEAAAVASRAILSFLKNEPSIDEIRLIFHSQIDLETFLQHHVF